MCLSLPILLPFLPILGDMFYFPPALSTPFHIFLPNPSPSQSWLSSCSFSLRVSVKGLLRDSVVFLPQCMPYPSPSSPSYLLLYSSLYRSLPNFFICDFFHPSNPQYLSQTLVDKKLALSWYMILKQFMFHIHTVRLILHLSYKVSILSSMRFPLFSILFIELRMQHTPSLFCS